uniref:Reticulon-like protein n=1 Tax=Elaeis guineensis var. tenera TaxID=51953 RepID=A0A6J0PLP3_ELAGV|nr:reticulon-like protein B8 isoform X2 [Elaeis guineensis]
MLCIALFGFHAYIKTEGKMPGHMLNAAESILNTIGENITKNVPKQISVRYSEEQNTFSTNKNKLLGHQKSIHQILGGGKSADFLLWRNKKISSSVLTGATATWVLFEWLQYHILTIFCLVLVIGMLIQFLWSNFSDVLSRSPSQVPRLVLPEKLFINVAVFIGAQINQFLGFIQDVACGRNLKKFLVVVASLWAAAVIGSWCNFLTLLYIVCQLFMRNMKTKLMTFCTTLLGRCGNDTTRWMQVFLAKYLKENLNHIRMSRLD